MGLTADVNDSDNSDSMEALKRRKLEAEIDELRLRTSSTQSDEKHKTLNFIIKYLVTIVPIAVALGGLILQWSEYRSSNERIARYEVGSEVITLTRQLGDDTSEKQSVFSAHLMSWFGDPAIFLLFEQLAKENRPAVRSALVMSLMEIARSNRPKWPRLHSFLRYFHLSSDERSILLSLLEYTDGFVKYAAVEGQKVHLKKIAPKLKAINELVGVLAPLELESDDREKLLKQLEDLRLFVATHFQASSSDKEEGIDSGKEEGPDSEKEEGIDSDKEKIAALIGEIENAIHSSVR